MLGLYVHIPFCSAICNYCNFNRGLFDADLKRRYVEALQVDIARSGDGAPADTVFFGGGTPSLLEPDEIASVLDVCRRSFQLAPDAEVTLEANPETVTPARLAAFRAAGVNRLSYGVQSFRDEELARLGRLHTAARAAEAFAWAREAGLDNLSLDLMTWLPNQSMADWLESVDVLAALGPEHASMYLLEIYPNAPLRDAMARGGWAVAADDEAADMYLLGLERLDRAGYRQYEISNVARPGRESRHNMKYWADGEWLGFGCGAHSTRGGARWRNLAATADYISTIREGRRPEAERRTLSPQAHLEEAVFMGLRLASGIDLAAMRERHGVDLWAEHGAELEPFVDAGVLVYDGRSLRLTRPGMLVAHEVMAVFIRAAVR